MKQRAYAKINLCLDVAGIREDGYHDLKMIMAPVRFYDLLETIPAEETTLTLNRSYLPVDDKNTIIKTIRLMQEEYGIDMEFTCNLQKQIPTRAGLGGGSADAAAAIRLIDSLCHLHMTSWEMLDIARQVGSDVPFCLVNKTSYVTGTGDVIEPFECNPDFELLLVKPRNGVSTKECFKLVDSTEVIHPDCMKMKEALINNDYEGVISSLGNSMETAAEQLVPDIADIKRDMKEMGFDGVLMSGSGSTVFGITRDHDLCAKAFREFKARKYFVRTTEILGEDRR